MIEGIDTLSTSPQEMDFLNSGQQTTSRILQAYGVNPIVVGEIVGANRAQAAVAEAAFVSCCVNPLLELMSQTLTRWVVPLFGEGLMAWFTPAVANDAELQLKRYDAGLKHGAVTINEFRAMLNLPPLPGGDAPPEPATVPANRNGRLTDAILHRS
jgi:phage portal protein BeeE